MLRRIFVGLLTLQLSAGLLPVSAAASSDADHIRSLRASALESCARGDVDTGLTTFDSAIRLAERTFGKDSSYVADLCFDAGVVALKKDQYQRAEDCLIKAVTLNPNGPEARLKLAEVYKVRGRLNDAKHQIEKVLGRDPSNLQARALLALTYQKEGNVAKATDEAYKLEQITSGQAAGDQFAITASPVAMAAPAPVAPVAAPTGSIGGFSRIPAPTPKPTPAPVPAPAPAPVAPAPAPTPAPKPVLKPVVPQRISPKHDRHHEKLDRRAALEMKRHHDKHEKKNAHVAHTSSGSVTDPSWGVQTRLNSKAKLLTPVPHAGKHHGGLVPPPPPVVPAFGGYAPPPPRPPVPQAAAPTPKPAAAAPKPSAPALKAAAPKVDPGESAGGGDDNNEDWMLDWAGKNKKKKK